MFLAQLIPAARAEAQPRSRSLSFALAIAVRWHILYPIAPRLCLLGFTFAQPLMLNRVLDHLALQDYESANIGYALIGAYTIVYVGIAVCCPVPSEYFLH